jgi:tetratricopeptide (TPR) repeat protein
MIKRGTHRRWLAALLLALPLLLVAASPTSDTALDEARTLVGQRKDAEAKPILIEIIEQHEDQHEAYHLLTRVTLREQDHKTAVKYAERAVELNDSISGYHMWLARAYLAKAMESGVINAYRYARRGKKHYVEAIRLDSTNLEARLELCMYLVNAPGIVGGDKKEGVIQAGVVEAQDSLMGAYAWASVFERDKKIAEAEARLRRAVELDTSSAYYALYALGYFLERNQKYDEAAGVFKEILARKPDEMSAVFQVGKICVLTESNLDEAESCFRRYLEVEAPPNAPDWAAAHWRLGMVYDLQGKIELALAELRKAVELAPGNKEFRKTLKEVEKKIER